MDSRGSTSSQASLSGSLTAGGEGLATPDSPRVASPSVSGLLGSSSRAAGIQGVIQSLQNEQEGVQKKTFTNWMNTYLRQRSPPMMVENLFEDIKDGTVLLSLLEVLSGDKLPMEKGAMLQRPHHIANITTALTYLKKRNIKLVNINATNIADGNPAIVLGLVWTIILYFQIEETISQVPNVPDMDGDGPSSNDDGPSPRTSLLAWVESVLAKKYGLQIKDFGKSWKDGVAFNAMIHNIRPDLVDMGAIRRQQARENLEHAFSTAANQLRIARLLDPDDVDVDRPDEKSIMTYVAQFLKAYPDAKDFRAAGSVQLLTDPAFLARTRSPLTAPQVTLRLSATAEADNLAAMAKAKKQYSNDMEEVCGGEKPYLHPDSLEQGHERCLANAIKLFHSTRKMGGPEFSKKYEDHLQKEIATMHDNYLRHNESKNLFFVFRTPAILFTMVVSFYVVASIFGIVGIETLANLANLCMFIFLILIVTWLYVRYSGEHWQFSQHIDQLADILWDNVLSVLQSLYRRWLSRE